MPANLGVMSRLTVTLPNWHGAPIWGLPLSPLECPTLPHTSATSHHGEELEAASDAGECLCLLGSQGEALLLALLFALLVWMGGGPRCSVHPQGTLIQGAWRFAPSRSAGRPCQRPLPPPNAHKRRTGSPSPPELMQDDSSGTSLAAAPLLLMACMCSSLWHISYRQPAAAAEVARVTGPCHLSPQELRLSSVLGSGVGRASPCVHGGSVR